VVGVRRLVGEWWLREGLGESEGATGGQNPSYSIKIDF